MPSCNPSIRPTDPAFRRLPWGPALCGLLVACHASAVLQSDRAELEPGTYVLSSLEGNPSPFVYFRVEYPDTLTESFAFVFDTVRILNDTDFVRHFRREVVELRPGQPTVLADSEEFDYAGIILDRGDEVKLTTRSGSPGGTAISYFAKRPGGLARHTQVSRYSCTQTTCTLLSDRRVDALYERR